MIISFEASHSLDRLLPNLLPSVFRFAISTRIISVLCVCLVFPPGPSRRTNKKQKSNLNASESQDYFGLPWAFDGNRQNGLSGYAHVRHTIALVTKLVTKPFSGVGNAMV